jgi:undecaprenyl-diphosphatase
MQAPMIVLVAFAPALVAGVIVWLLIRRWPVLDPASPRVAAHGPGQVLENRPGRHRYIQARLDPAAATGLALTITVAVVIVGGVAFGIILAMVRAEVGVSHYDVDIARWASTHATDASTALFKLVTELGGSRVLFPLTIVLLVVEYRRVPSHGRSFLRSSLVGFLVLAVVGQNLLSNTIKWLVDRVRPDIHPLAGFSGPSFPSGHTTAAAACFAAFALVLGRRRPIGVKAALAGAAVAIALAVGATRVMLGVHWFTDVVGGLFLGWAWFAVCSVAFGGRLLRFGAPVEVAERAEPLTAASGDRQDLPVEDGEPSVGVGAPGAPALGARRQVAAGGQPELDRPVSQG